MRKFVFLLFLLPFILTNNLYAESQEKWNQFLYDSIRPAKDKGDSIVDLDKIKLALDKGANPNWINPKNLGKSVLAHFVEVIGYSDNPETIEKGAKALDMLFKNKAKLQSSSDDTILFWPIVWNQYEIVKILLENGANATFWPKGRIIDGYNFDPIDEATSQNYEKTIELLVSHGAKRLTEKEAAQLRFIRLAGYGSIDELKEQVKKGAEVNTRNKNQETALINALSEMQYGPENQQRVMYLLDIGADVNLKGKTFLPSITTPIHVAVYSLGFAFKENINTTYARNTLQELIKRKASISAQDDDGKTPLHIAVERNYIDAARLILELGAKTTIKDKAGKTPIDYAKSDEMRKLIENHRAKRP